MIQESREHSVGCSIIKYNDIGESAGLPHEIFTVGREEVKVRLLGHEDRPRSLELAPTTASLRPSMVNI